MSVLSVLVIAGIGAGRCAIAAPKVDGHVTSRAWVGELEPHAARLPWCDEAEIELDAGAGDERPGRARPDGHRVGGARRPDTQPEPTVREVNGPLEPVGEDDRRRHLLIARF